MDIGITQIAMVILVIMVVLVAMKLLPLPAELHQVIRQLKPLIQRLNEEVAGLLQEASQTVQKVSRVTGHVGFVFVMAQDREDHDTFDAVKQDLSQSLRIARRFMRFGTYLIVRKVGDWLNRLL